jgi:hypothetical protein
VGAAAPSDGYRAGMPWRCMRSVAIARSWGRTALQAIDAMNDVQVDVFSNSTTHNRRKSITNMPMHHRYSQQLLLLLYQSAYCSSRPVRKEVKGPDSIYNHYKHKTNLTFLLHSEGVKGGFYKGRWQLYIICIQQL